MRRLTLLAVLVLVMSTQNALGWGDIGHRIVCRIAFNELDDEQQDELDRLARLYKKHDRDYSNFPQACFFPDQVRKRPAFSSFRKTHFVNVSRSTETIDPADSSCADTICVLEGIELHSTKLSEASSDVNRAEALFFLGHWVGDVHQPLHVSYSDDSGGNDIVVASDFYFDTELHGLWDTGIIRSSFSQNTGWRNYADQLHALIDDAERTEWLQASHLDWAQESYEIVLRDAVDYCRRTGSGCQREFHKRRPKAAYQAMFQPVVEERLQKAGVRLAEEIRKALFNE